MTTTQIIASAAAVVWFASIIITWFNLSHLDSGDRFFGSTIVGTGFFLFIMMGVGLVSLMVGLITGQVVVV